MNCETRKEYQWQLLPSFLLTWCTTTKAWACLWYEAVILFSAVIFIIIISLLYPQIFRVAYAANISKHLPTQPLECTHKDQTTTPGTTLYIPYSLQTVSGFFNIPQRYLRTRVQLRDWNYIVWFITSFSEKTRNCYHLQI